MEKREDISLEKSIIDFSTIEYSRELEERALYPFSSLNYMTGGMELHEISLIAGEAGAGKTSLVSTIIASMLKDGEKIFCVYGESTIKKQALQTYRQLTPYGDDSYEYIEYEKNGKRTNIGQYFVSKTAEASIKEKTKEKLFYYDTRRGMSIKKILEATDYSLKKNKTHYGLLDNLTQIELATNDEVRETKDGMEDLRRYVIDNPIHEIVLAHYRKSNDYTNLRRTLGEIMGTGAIGQKVATAMNIIRLDNIDRSNKNKSYISLKNVMELNDWDLDKKNDKNEYEITAVIEVLKTRFNRLGFVAIGFNRKTQTFFEIKKHYNNTKNDDSPKLFEKTEAKKTLSSFDDILLLVEDDSLPF